MIVKKGRTFEYARFGFKTDKGTFALVGSSRKRDTFKHLESGMFHTWDTTMIFDWFESGKIEPIEEATFVTWYQK